MLKNVFCNESGVKRLRGLAACVQEIIEKEKFFSHTFLKKFSSSRLDNFCTVEDTTSADVALDRASKTVEARFPLGGGAPPPLADWGGGAPLKTSLVEFDEGYPMRGHTRGFASSSSRWQGPKLFFSHTFLLKKFFSKSNISVRKHRRPPKVFISNTFFQCFELIYMYFVSLMVTELYSKEKIFAHTFLLKIQTWTAEISLTVEDPESMPENFL